MTRRDVASVAEPVGAALRQAQGPLSFRHTDLSDSAARVVLSTGPRQPEAVRLYLAAGYEPLFDRSLDAEQIVIHHFEKELS